MSSTTEHKEQKTKELSEGLHPTFASYRLQQRRYLAYYLHAMREPGGENSAINSAIRQDAAYQKSRMGERIATMQELIKGGMDAIDARRYVEQQQGEDAGYQIDPESVDGMLFEDRKKRATAILEARISSQYFAA
ncbi:MAG: hypothetical protein O2904_03485 [bacterium]|nr:hypothetical protein [bacterium]